MYYRRDVLAAAKLPVPATWDDLLLVAQTLNGSDFNNDGRPDYAMCLQIAGSYCYMDASYLIPGILPQYTQVKVSKHAREFTALKSVLVSAYKWLNSEACRDKPGTLLMCAIL